MCAPLLPMSCLHYSYLTQYALPELCLRDDRRSCIIEIVDFLEDAQTFGARKVKVRAVLHLNLNYSYGDQRSPTGVHQWA